MPLLEGPVSLSSIQEPCNGKALTADPCAAKLRFRSVCFNRVSRHEQRLSALAKAEIQTHR